MITVLSPSPDRASAEIYAFTDILPFILVMKRVCESSRLQFRLSAGLGAARYKFSLFCITHASLS